MSSLQILPGSIAVAMDRLVAVVRIEQDGSVVIRDLANGSLLTTSAGELSAAPNFANEHEDFALASLTKATEVQWERARQRERAVSQLLHGDVLDSDVARIAARQGVSRRTVYRWLARYREAPQTSSLLPKPPGTPIGARRIDRQIEDIISEVINKVFLTRPRGKKEDVVREVQGRCIAQGIELPSCKPILVRLKALDPRVVARAQLQAAEVNALHKPVPGNFRVDRALEVMEIDHTRVDVIVVDGTHRQPIDRPWLTLAVDVATRMVLGFYVSLEAPSATSVALALT